MIYTNKSINIISLIITIIFFLILNIYFCKDEKIPIGNITSKISKQIKKDKNETKDENKTKDEIIEEKDIGNWYIEIPTINLKAPIAEGTDSSTLNTKVGHFEETSLVEGNVGLAAHNRGYEYNYFENLKKLKKEDKIIYNYNEYKKVYIINKIEIIENTDWSYLEQTEENKITLITCIENQPLYRRCVQAVETEN